MFVVISPTEPAKRQPTSYSVFWNAAPPSPSFAKPFSGGLKYGGWLSDVDTEVVNSPHLRGKNVGELLDEGSVYANALLEDRLRQITRTSGDDWESSRPELRRRSIDMGARECSAIAKFVSWNVTEVARTSQLTRRKEIVPVTPSCLRLKATVLKFEKVLSCGGAEPQASHSAVADDFKEATTQEPECIWGGGPLLGVDSCRLLLRNVLSTLESLESHWGSFHIWVQQPRLSTCKSLIRAWRTGENFDEFFAWFCEHELGLAHDTLAPYIATVLLGTRISGTDLIMPGDMTVRHSRGNEINIADSAESELHDKLLRAARMMRARYAYDGRVDSHGKILSEIAYIDPLYSETGEIEALGTIDKASWDMCAPPEISFECNDWNTMFKSAGLTPRQRGALLLRKNDQITSRSDLNEWKRGERAIKGRRSKLMRAIEAATKKRIIKAPCVSAGNHSGVIRDGMSFIFKDLEGDTPLQRHEPELEAPKWFHLKPPPIRSNVRKTRHLFKKVSTR
jgi:hypothetical protein